MQLQESQPIRRRAPWLAAGVAVGLILAPAAAVAAGVTLTSIVGPSGTRAAVTKAGQLETNPIDITNVRQYGYVTLSTTCQKIAAPPAGHSLILTQIYLNTLSVSSPGTNSEAGFAVGSSCTSNQPLTQLNPSANGGLTIPFTPGFVIPAGKALYAAAFNVTVNAFAMGYLVPSADAPSQTPIAAIAHGGRS